MNYYCVLFIFFTICSTFIAPSAVANYIDVPIPPGKYFLYKQVFTSFTSLSRYKYRISFFCFLIQKKSKKSCQSEERLTFETTLIIVMLWGDCNFHSNLTAFVHRKKMNYLSKYLNNYG